MRIASLLSSSTEILYTLGLEESIVAVSHECDFPTAAGSKPRATRTNISGDTSSGQIDRQVHTLLEQGRALYELDVPLLVQLQPDLIITQAQCDVCAIRYSDVMEAVDTAPALRGAQVLALQPDSLGDVLDDILRIAEVTNSRIAGEAIIADLSRRVDFIEHRTRSLAEHDRPRVACIEWLDPLMAAGNWMPELIHLSGGRQPFCQPGRHSGYVEWDAVRQYNPQVIVVAPCGFDRTRAVQEMPLLTRLEGWADIDAVSNRRVHVADGNAYFNRSGPRLIDTLELLAHLLHPTVFGCATHLKSASLRWE